MTRIYNDLDSLHKLIVKLNVLDNLEIFIGKDRENHVMKVRIALEWENAFASYKGYRPYKTPLDAVEDITAGMKNDWVIAVTESQRVSKYFAESRTKIPSV